MKQPVAILVYLAALTAGGPATTVDAGVAKIIRKQESGWSHIQPGR